MWKANLSAVTLYNLYIVARVESGTADVIHREY